jgi:hypothetical protein
LSSEYATKIANENKASVDYPKFHVKFLQPPTYSKEYGQCASIGSTNAKCNNSRKYGTIYCYRHLEKKDKVTRYSSNKELFKLKYIDEDFTMDRCMKELLEPTIEFIQKLIQRRKYILWNKINKYSSRNKLNIKLEKEYDVSLEGHFELIVAITKTKIYMNKTNCFAMTKHGRQCENRRYKNNKFCSVHKDKTGIMTIQEFLSAHNNESIKDEGPDKCSRSSSKEDEDDRGIDGKSSTNWTIIKSKDDKGLVFQHDLKKYKLGDMDGKKQSFAFVNVSFFNNRAYYKIDGSPHLLRIRKIFYFLILDLAGVLIKK